MNLYQKIVELQKDRKSAVLVTVISVKGSVPRGPGAKMIVFEDGRIQGTIGGGAVEKLVIEEALQSLKTAKPAVVKHNLDDKLASDTGMVCGGKMYFFLEPLYGSGMLYIFGGGHIAQYLSELLDMMEWPYTVIDDREEFCNSTRFPNAADLFVEHPADYAENMESSRNDFLVVITRGHEHDYEIVRNVLKKNFAYLGMIGSRVKRLEIYRKLIEADGFSDHDLAAIHSPIGLDIKAESPQEIALSIMAELIQIRNSKS